MNNIVDALKEKGLKQTRHRMAILNILKRADQPLSAEAVFMKLKEKESRINLSTVYRNLEMLSDNEMINKLNLSGDNRTVFEYNHNTHRHYLICLGCKKILPLEHCPLKGYEEKLGEETGYAIVGHKLDIYGYCPQCLEKKKNRT